MIILKCPKCFREIPEDSEFCPFCMVKFSEAGLIKTKPIESKKKTKGIIIALLAVLVIAASLGVIVMSKNIKQKSSVETPKISAKLSTESIEKPTETTTEATENLTSTTTKKTTPKPTIQPRPSKSDIANEYIDVLSEMYSGDTYGEYYIFDINDDGISELIVRTGDCELNAAYCFYTFYKGELKYLGSAVAAHSSLFAPKSGNGVLAIGGNMGAYHVTRYTVDDTRFSSELIVSGGGIGESITFDDVTAKYCGNQLEYRELNDYDYILNMMN